MSSPVKFQLESRYEVLSPRCRWDFCLWQIRAPGRKHQNFRVVGEEIWRCCAQDFLLGLGHDFEMAVGSRRSTLGSEIEKIEEVSINGRDKAWLLVGSSLDVFSRSFPLFEQQAGCLFGSISPFEYDRYLKQDSKLFFIWFAARYAVDSLLIWLFTACDVSDGALLFSLWQLLAKFGPAFATWLWFDKAVSLLSSYFTKLLLDWTVSLLTC